jgi:AcrR family transcriptional regulator
MPNKKPAGSPEGRVEAQRRRQILDAAAACVAEEGADRLTLRKVAHRARVTTGMITYYFTNKDELMIATLNESARRVRERVDEVEGGSLAKIRKAFEVAMTHPEETANFTFWLEYAARAARIPALRHYHAQRLATTRAWHVNAMRGLIEEGQLDGGLDPSLVADLVVALYQGLGLAVTLDSEAVPPERAIAILDLVLTALQARD